MNYRSIARSPLTFLALSSSCVLTSLVFRGPSGAAGMALGVTGAGFSVSVLWLAIKQIGQVGAEGPKASFRSCLLVLVFFAKLPLYMILGMVAHAIGGGAPTCFLLGVALVYFCLIGWALAQG